MGKHALVVEDDANTATALCHVLQTLDFTTATAPTLKEARASMAEKLPEVVLLDLSLPDGNGLEFMVEMKESLDTRFVVITGNMTQEAAVESLRANADDFLVKPVSLSEVRSTISRSIERLDSAGNTEISAAEKNDEGKNEPDSIAAMESESGNESDVVDALVGKTFWSLEKDLLFATLQHHNGDKPAAAKTLGISLKTLYNRLHAYT